jgi:ribonucleotide reductase alpha subunit
MVHPHEIFLRLNDIGQRRIRAVRPRTNGFVEQFKRTGWDEILREAFRNTFYASTKELQERLDKRQEEYNYQRPHRGYRRIDKRRIGTIEAGKRTRGQMLKEAA